MPKRLGFFTRLLDQGSAQTRYRLAAEQIRHAERLGFDSAWIAQHHFHEQEGGLPSPLVFLAHVAAQTDRIRLGTAIITLPMENPLRVAEDAAVLDLLTDGRLEVGFGSGGTPTSFLPFGLTSEQRGATFADHLHLKRNIGGAGQHAVLRQGGNNMLRIANVGIQLLQIVGDTVTFYRMTRRPVLSRLLAQTGLGDLQGVGVTVGDEGGARGEDPRRNAVRQR